MLDGAIDTVVAILAMSVGGVSVVTIIGMAIYIIKAIAKGKREIKITKESITEGFKETIIPKNIKLDLSTKIEEPLYKGFAEMKAEVRCEISQFREEVRLMLLILSKFSHVDKLTEEERNMLDMILDDNVMEITL